MGAQGTISPKVFLSGHREHCTGLSSASQGSWNVLLDGEHHLGSTKGSLPLFFSEQDFSVLPAAAAEGVYIRGSLTPSPARGPSFMQHLCIQRTRACPLSSSGVG